MCLSDQTPLLSVWLPFNSFDCFSKFKNRGSNLGLALHKSSYEKKNQVCWNNLPRSLSKGKSWELFEKKIILFINHQARKKTFIHHPLVV